MLPSVPNCPLALNERGHCRPQQQRSRADWPCSVTRESWPDKPVESQSAVIAITTGTVYVQPEVLGGVV